MGRNDDVERSVCGVTGVNKLDRTRNDRIKGLMKVGETSNTVQSKNGRGLCR